MADFCQTFMLKKTHKPNAGAGGEERKRDRERDPTKGTHKKINTTNTPDVFSFD